MSYGKHSEVRNHIASNSKATYFRVYTFNTGGSTQPQCVTCLPNKKSPPKERSHILIYGWTNFSFDYDTYLLCHCFELLLSFCNVSRFNSVQCGNNFYQNLVLMMGETDTCKKCILKILNGVNVCTLWLLIHVWKWHLILHKQLFPKTIREEKILMHKNVT